MIETTDGDVMVLQCLAALPKNDRLDAEDQDTLTKLEEDVGLRTYFLLEYRRVVRAPFM